MTEIAFTPRDGAEGDACGITDGEGRFFGFTVEIVSCEPGDYDPLDPESFLQKYFPEHWEEYEITEVGDKDNDAYYPGTYDYFGYAFRNSLTFDADATKAQDLADEDNSALEAEGAVFEPVKLAMGNYPQYDIQAYELTVVGAEFFRHDGKEAVRVIYDVKNTDTDKNRVWQAYEYFHLTAVQDGENLLTVETELTKQGHYRLVQPGESEEYVLEYIVRSDSPVEAEVNYMAPNGGEFDGKTAGKVYMVP